MDLRSGAADGAPPSPERLRRLYDDASRLTGLGAWECDLASERLTWTRGVYRLFGVPLDATLRRATIVDLYDD